MDLKFFLRKNRRFVFFGSLVAIAFVMFSCAAVADRDSEDDSVEKVFVPEVKTVIVAPGLSREVAATGEVRAAKSATLTAEARSDVKKVFVKVGDNVQAGQTLLQLSSASVSSTRSTAGAAFVNARNSLAQTQLSSEKSIQAARIALETAEINLANTLKQNVALRKQAEEVLNSSKLSSGLSVASAQTTLENAIRSAYPVAQNAVSKSDEIIGVSPIYDSSNDNFESFLGALKSASKSSAESAISIALQLLNSPAEDYSTTLTLLRAVEDATVKTLDTLNFSTTGMSFTQATLNANVATINAQLSAVRAAISSLNSTQTALESAQQNSNGTSQTVLSAEANYQATLAQLETNEKAMRQAVESAKAALESSMKSSELSKTSAKASLDSIAGNLNQAQISQSKLTIRAPFSGKVTAVSVEAGDEVSMGSALIQVEDANKLKIIAHLSTSEVRKIQVGDEVKIAKSSLDRVAAIAPSADPLTKKYEVEIYHENPYLQPGEFVKLRFRLGENGTADSRIFLPINAINILSYGSFVWKMEESTIESSQLTVDSEAEAEKSNIEVPNPNVQKFVVKQEVELGEIEGEFVEIVGGLELNEEVVTEGGRILDVSRERVEVVVGS